MSDNTMDTYLIELDGHRYEVRVIQGQRQILFEGEWTPAFEFVDTLADRGEWGRVCELAKLGDNILRHNAGHHLAAERDRKSHQRA
jgi:hypothetical protein